MNESSSAIVITISFYFLHCNRIVKFSAPFKITSSSIHSIDTTPGGRPCKCWSVGIRGCRTDSLCVLENMNFYLVALLKEKSKNIDLRSKQRNLKLKLTRVRTAAAPRAKKRKLKN